MLLQAKRGLLFVCALSLVVLSVGHVAMARASVLETPSMSSLDKELVSRLVLGKQYKGTYYCNQGLTDVSIGFYHMRYNGLTKIAYFRGVFSFYYNATQQGSFEIDGYFDGNELTVKGGDWIKRPSGYMTVGLKGNYNANNGGFSGKVIGDGCTTFNIVPTDELSITPDYPID